MPPASVRQNNPSQRRRASAGVCINRSVLSSGAARQPKFDAGPLPRDPGQDASRREKSSRIGSWTAQPPAPHARPNAAACGGPDSGAGVSPVSAGVSPAWVFAGETPVATAGTAAPLRWQCRVAPARSIAARFLLSFWEQVCNLLPNPTTRAVSRSCSLAMLHGGNWMPEGLSRNLSGSSATVDNDCYEIASYSLSRPRDVPDVGSVWGRVGATIGRRMAMAAGDH